MEANAGFSLSDLTEDSEDDEMRMDSGVSGVGAKKKVTRNGNGGMVNGKGKNGLVRGSLGGGAQEYREVAQKENSQPPLR